MYPEIKDIECAKMYYHLEDCDEHPVTDGQEVSFDDSDDIPFKETNHMQEIISVLQAFGLITDGLITDGEIHRCHSSAKKKKNKDGWYAVKEYNGQYYCSYGCWVRQEKGRCSTVGGSDRTDHKAWEHLEAVRLLEQVDREKKGKIKAKQFLADSSGINDPHEYLQKKQISTCGTLRKGDLIVIPLYNRDGDVSSCQTINRKGVKHFMAGGTVGGCCFPIQGNEDIVCICEGFATGASIFAATGHKVLVAMNAGNLVKIAKAAIEKFPMSTVLICADNDHTKKKNVGLEMGKKVAFDLGLSCVYPTGIIGSDFNDMAVELGLDAVKQEIIQMETIEVLTPEDCVGEDLSLQIPAGAIPAGLIEQGLEALEGDILQYSLPMVLSVIARSIAGKISINGVHPNIFNLKVGGTSTGKTATDRKFLDCLDIDGFVSCNDVASGPGLWRAIAENPLGMGFFDEISSIFQRSSAKGGIDIVVEGKINALLDVYSRSGQSFKKGYGDAKNSITINNPCFSLIGNATPTIFEAIQLKDFETGLMQRFDFWFYDGDIKEKALLLDGSYFEKTVVWIEELRKRVQFNPPQTTLADLIKGCVKLEATPRALVFIREYSSYITEEANKAESDGMVGFMSRRFDLSLKYALIHHAATTKIEKLQSPVSEKDIQYGILMAEMLGGWKTNVLGGKVVSGDFHRDCEIFKAAIKAAVKSGKRKPTFKILMTRKAQLKNWNPKYSEIIINVLKKRGEIITKEGPKSTQYFLPKEGEI